MQSRLNSKQEKAGGFSVVSKDSSKGMIHPFAKIFSLIPELWKTSRNCQWASSELSFVALKNVI